MNVTELAPYLKMYSNTQKELWTGRKSAPELGVQFWHQQVSVCDLNESISIPQNEKNIALLGYACDEGVKRNKGRVGAAAGPEVIRKQLSRLAFHHHPTKVIDYGTLHCKNKELEFCQNALSEVIEFLLKEGAFPIVLGGSHDMSYGHFSGIQSALRSKGKSKIGIINFDAHFDLRPLKKEPNSGTPFYQIMTENEETVSYFVLGIQEVANTRELFEIAKDKKVDYLLNDTCELNNLEIIKGQLDPFLEKNDALYLTVDLDGFSSAYAPGVSAPSPLGFTPNFFFKVLDFLMNSQKVVAVDIAELNPKYDRDHCTASLAARIVDAVVKKV